ncbi:MAG: hypothetical protein JNN12_14615 [Bacteroidetes Order II. Incertae sedis bacterium]|nr:hypothetical protein [Bacteroidetes Order II. bacterium]
MKKWIYLLFVVLMPLTGCSMFDTHEESAPFIGTWKIVEADEYRLVYEKTTPKEDAWWITFKGNGKMEMNTFGFCGTPPLVYYKLKGTWQLSKPDKLIVTYSEFPEQNTIQQWQILSHSNNRLEVRATYLTTPSFGPY